LHDIAAQVGFQVLAAPACTLCNKHMCNTYSATHSLPACCHTSVLQVLMQLAQAYLTCGQPNRVLDCISLLQGLSTGRTPPAGLLHLSSLALLQLGKLGAASAQLCAWLAQGGHSAEEACDAVRSFLVALHTPGAVASPGTAAGQVSAGAAATASAAGDSVQAQAAAPGQLSSSCCTPQERAAAVQQVAAAAAEHCGSNPAVGLEVVMQLLSSQGSGIAHSLEKLAVKVLANAEVSQLLHQVSTGPWQCRRRQRDVAL
jgi:hypothetical protein